MNMLKFISIVVPLLCTFLIAADRNTDKNQLSPIVTIAYSDDSKSDGSSSDTTEVISESKLPSAVSDSLKANYHGNEVKKVEKITSKGRTRYQIEFKNGKKVTLDKDGRRYYK